MNYGSIGFLIAHGITHGFSNLDTELDEVGKIVDWSDPVSKANLMKRVQCLIDQANNYTVESIGKNVSR